MQTLLTLFSKGRSDLQTELNQAKSLKQVVKLIQHRIDRLEKTYTGELSVTQVRLVNFFLDALRQSLSIAAANETASDLEPEQLVTSTTRFSPSLILKLLQAIVCIVILASLFSLTRTEPEVWMPILLMSVLVGLEVVLQLSKNDQSSSIQPVEAFQQPVRVDSNVLLDHLAEALNTIDIAVSQVDEVNTPLTSSGLEDLTEILDLLQRLVGASLINNPLMALELTKLIPQILLKQGIQAQSYQPNDEHLSENFDFEPSIDPSAKDYVTLTPALLKGEKLLCRGRVIQPTNATAKD